jgi:hypothetical protein
MKTTFTATHVAAASALALVIGGFAGYFLAPDSADSNVSATAKNTCSEVDTSDAASQAFGRLTGSGKTISSQLVEKSSSVNSYSYSCSVSVNGKSKLLLSADLRQSGSVNSWKDDLAANGDIGPERSRKSFAVGTKGSGVSSPFSAAIYLECKPTGSTLRAASNLNIEATLLPRESNSSSNRSDVIKLARSLAVHAQSGAHCENPERITTE